MKTRDYLVLAGIALVLIGISALTTTQPPAAFLTDGLTTAGQTILTMVWITWWALVLGFAIAGGVEAWVSDERIATTFEGSSPRDLGLAAFFGFISSSCSYSAIATAKNLFRKGASAPAALGAFMFAATNLVIELGFVIWLLLGWQFVLANYVGGLILIGVMAVLLRVVVPDSLIETARENAADGDETVVDPVCGMELSPDEASHTITTGTTTHYFCSASCKESFNPDEQPSTITQQIFSREGWERLADKQWSEWMMLWKEIAVGFIVAGLIAGFVPESLWAGLFAQETLGMPIGLVWAAIVGAIIGVATFVCSVGNVPFATVLWASGLPFGGIFSYIYADLIVPPIAAAYREYYGPRFGLILTGIIFVGAVLSGILTHLIFGGLGLIPPRAGVDIAENTIELDYKAALNGFFTLVFIVLYWLHRRSGASQSSDAVH